MSKPVRDSREGNIIRCEAVGCNGATVWSSPSWRKTWRMVWVEEIGISLSACSDHCSDEIRGGRYRVLNEPMKPTKAKLKAQQTKLFR